MATTPANKASDWRIALKWRHLIGHLADVLPHVPDLVLLVPLGLPAGLLGHVGAAVELDLEV